MVLFFSLILALLVQIRFALGSIEASSTDVAVKIKNLASLVHVISPFPVEDCSSQFCPYDQAQSVTIGSMLRAKAKVEDDSITLAAAVFERDLATAVPTGFHTLPVLTRSTETEYPNLSPQSQLPFIQDIFDSVLVDDELTFDYLVYTNSDITVHEDFYSLIQEQIHLHGYEFFTINRRTIASKRRAKGGLLTASDLNEIFDSPYKSHPGTDCFIIKKSIVEKFQLGDVFLGAPFFSNSILLQGKYHSTHYARFSSDDMKATFHLSDDKRWKDFDRLRFSRQNGLNAICKNRWVQTICSSIELPTDLNESNSPSLLPYFIECRKLTTKMQKYVDALFDFNSQANACPSLLATSSSRAYDSLPGEDSLRRVLDEDKLHSSFERVKFVFALGIEGTGHHFLSDLENRSEIKSLLQDNDLRDLQNEAADLLRWLYWQRNIVQNNGMDLDPAYKLFVSKLKRLGAEVEEKIIPAIPENEVVTVHLNTINDIMTSFPALHSEARYTQLPDLGILYRACSSAGIACGHLLMSRDAHEVIRSTTENRNFDSGARQITNLSMQLNIMISQAFQYPDKLLGCFDYNDPVSSLHLWRTSSMFGWNIQDSSLKNSIVSSYQKSTTLSGEDGHDLTPRGYEIYMEAMVRATETLRTTCLQLLAGDGFFVNGSLSKNQKEVHHESKSNPTPIRPLRPPFKVVQIGSPRTASTFQFQLLDAIVSLKSPHGTKIESRFLGKKELKDGAFESVLSSNESFVIKVHHEPESLEEASNAGQAAVFASSNNTVTYALHVQERENLEQCTSCEIARYKTLFDLDDKEVEALQQRMHDFQVIRQCCGLQMSKYEVLRLNGCNVTEYVDKPYYPRCERQNLTAVESRFANSIIPYHANNPDYNWAKPGDCARFNAEIAKGKGFNGRALDSCEIHGKVAGKSGSINTRNLFRGLESADSSIILSPILRDYIDFHRSSIEDGRLRDGVKYLVYECKELDERCGGVGDRMLGMIKSLYLAVCTKRVLLIDSTFPVSLANYLIPNRVQWNATFPSTTNRLDVFHDEMPLSLHRDIIGYRISGTNGSYRRRLLDVLNSTLMKDYMTQNGYDTDISFAKRMHQGFWTLFKFSDAVLSRRTEIKTAAGLHHQPYLGLHHRHGDMAFPGIDAIKKRMKRFVDSSNLLTCFKTFNEVFPERTSIAYLASDDVSTKRNLSSYDPNIRVTGDMKIFHMDKSTRMATTNGKTRWNDMEASQGALDVWAELAVLADAECLVVSNSMFGFMTYYIRGEDKCSVHVLECNAKAIGKYSHAYDYEAGNIDSFLPTTPQAANQKHRATKQTGVSKEKALNGESRNEKKERRHREKARDNKNDKTPQEANQISKQTGVSEGKRASNNTSRNEKRERRQRDKARDNKNDTTLKEAKQISKQMVVSEAKRTLNRASRNEKREKRQREKEGEEKEDQGEARQLEGAAKISSTRTSNGSMRAKREQNRGSTVSLDNMDTKRDLKKKKKEKNKKDKESRSGKKKKSSDDDT